MRVEILNTGSELMLGFVTNTRCAGAADDSVTGTLADVVQNVGSMTMMQVRDLALEQAMEIKPIKYKSTQLETATFTGTYTPTESDRFLVMFSDDGYKITVKLGGEEVFKEDALNRGQHLPNVDGNPSATRSLHLLPIVLEKGVTYEIEVVYRNKFYYGTTDIDGITVFVVDSATEFEMCSAVCAPAGGMKPTTAVGDPHDVHIRARVDTDGRTRTYKVTFRAHNPPNGLVRVDDIEVEDLDGGLPILFFQKGTLNNHATFSVSSQVLPGVPNMLTKRLQVTVHFKGVNPGSVTLSFYDKRTERATDVGWELLRDNTAIPGDERKTWLVGTGEVAAVANAGGAVSGARAYLPRGGGTVEVVVKADLGAGVAHDVIKEWPEDHEDNPWPTRVLAPEEAGTLTEVIRGHGTASTIFGANPDFVGEATLTWTTGTSTNVATITVWNGGIASLTFALANGRYGVRKDDNSGFYPSPHWTAENAANNNLVPVCYTRSGTYTIGAAGFTITSCGTTTGKLRGAASSGGVFEGDVTIGNGTFSLNNLPLRFSQTVGNQVTYLNPMTITWSLSVDGGNTYLPVGMTKNPVYVILQDPVDFMQQSLFRTVLHLACSNGGATDEVTAFAKSWSLFESLSLTTWDGKPLYYYRDGCNFASSAQEPIGLLVSAQGAGSCAGSGRCGAFAHLLGGVAGANGIVVEQTAVTANDAHEWLLIKDWTFPENGFYGNEPVYKWKLTLVDEDPTAAVDPGMVPVPPDRKYGDLTYLTTARGQNSAPPSEAYFQNHQIVKFGDGHKYYDPSYGRTYEGATKDAAQDDFNQKSVAGYIFKTPPIQNEPLNFKVRKPEGNNNIKFTPIAP